MNYRLQVPRALNLARCFINAAFELSVIGFFSAESSPKTHDGGRCDVRDSIPLPFSPASPELTPRCDVDPSRGGGLRFCAPFSTKEDTMGLNTSQVRWPKN